MPKKFLVIDANILIRAVLGSRVRQLINGYSDSVAFYIAEANLNEAEFRLSQLLAQKRNLDEAEWRSVFNELLTNGASSLSVPRIKDLERCESAIRVGALPLSL